MKGKFKRFLSLMLIVMLISTICLSGYVPFASATTNASTSTNIALGKSVSFGYGSQTSTYNDAYSVAKVTNGLSVLTDGDNYNVNYWVNNGNPNIALQKASIIGPYSFTVDLAESCYVSEISLHNYTRTAWGVYPLDSVTYSYSTDGSTWKTLGTVQLADAVVNNLTDPAYTAEQGNTLAIYEFNLSFDEVTARYIKADFDNNSYGTVAFGEFEVYGEKLPSIISTGKEVSFGYGSNLTSDGNYDVSAITNNISAITDGVTNSPNYWANNGYYTALKSTVVTGPYSFTMYMGGLATVRNISTYYLQRYSADVPTAVNYYVSADGVNWKSVGTVTSVQASYTTSSDSNGEYRIHKFSLDIAQTDVMFVRATFEQNDDSDIMIFLGEFEVRGSMLDKSISTLSSGLMSSTSNYTYEISGGGKTTHPNNTSYTVEGYEKKDLALLTDNTGGSYVQFYRNDFRTITLDLGSVSNVTSFHFRFASAEASGIYLPSKVQYYASENGSDYYLVKTIMGYEAKYNTTIGSYRLYMFSTNTVSVNARYVKIVFPVSVNCYADELYIYGYKGSPSTQATPLTSFEKYDPNARYVGSMADTSLSGGVRNEYLAYSGWSYGSDGTCLTTQKVKDEYLSAISYVDMNDVPQDWLYDGVTLIPHHHTSGGKWNLYQASATTGSSYANKDDWYQWLCYEFGKDTSGNDIYYNSQKINLPALEAAVASAKETLNDPDYKVKVKITVFPAVHYQNNWGTLDGKAIDFTVSGAGSISNAIANRKAAYQWYVDTVLQMWEEAGFEHLEFAGFYYFEEAIREGTDSAANGTIKALTEIVHNTPTPSTNTLPAFDDSQGGKLYIYQIPFYQAEGYYDWKEYGFDYAIMQPNLSFVSATDGLAQLKTCAESCEYYGLGFEMEFGGVSDTYINKFQYYLNYGQEYGYANTVLGWYMGTWGVNDLSNGRASTSYSNTRYIYDDIYEFVKANREALAVKGDVNGDGVLSIKDATKIQMYLAKLIDFNESQIALADISGDGVVSIKDVTTIQLKLAKIIE